MRIALVVRGGLHPSGREEVVPLWLALLEHLAQVHDVHAFSVRHLREPRVYSLRGAMVHDLGRPGHRWAEWRALRAAIGAVGTFDIVHGIHADPAGLLAVLAGRRFRIPSIVTCDSGEFVAIPHLHYGVQRSLIGRGVVWYTCRHAAAVHVASQYMEQRAREFGVGVHRLPTGIDTSRFAVASRRAGPPWRLLQVASLNAVKDHAALLRALARLRSRHDVQLDLVGEDTLHGRLQRQARELGVADIVTFHGFVPYDELPAIYGRAHLYVQSSRHEAGGVAVLEAAAAGLPIVGTRVGFVSDWDGHGALAVAPGDSTALAEAIASLLADRERRNALARAAHRQSGEYDVRVTTPRIVEMYQDVIERFRHD